MAMTVLDRMRGPRADPLFFRLLLAALVASAVPATAAEPAIGVAAPITGDFSIIGKQVETGARAANKNANAESLTVEDDQCSAEGGAASADRLIDAGVRLVIGYPCIEAFDAAMPKLAAAGIPVIVIGIEAEGITKDLDKKGWKLVRLAPKSSDEATAAATWLRKSWRKVNFAVIDDGTLYGRQFAEAVRFAMEEDNLKPVFTDTYRPQLENQVALVRRLQKSGATHAVIGGDAFDAAVIGQDAKSAGVQLTLAGGSALVEPPTDAGPLVNGTIVVAEPLWQDQPPARKAVETLIAESKTAEGYTIPAYAAVEVAQDVLASGDGEDPYVRLKMGRFETAMGPIAFDGNGDLKRNLYHPFIVVDGKLVPAAQAAKAIQ